MNHAWSGGPMVIMSKYFAGIRPLKAGYSEFIIKPQMSEPDTIKCVVPSVIGYITVTETRTDASFVLDASVPAGTKALVCVPYSDGQSVKLNGSVICKNNSFAGADNVAFVEADGGFAVFSVTAAENTDLHFEAVG
jgi:hypothetical protein